MQHQDALLPTAAQHRGGQVQAVGVAGATQAHIEGRALVAQAQARVDHATGRWQKVVGRLGDHDQAGDGLGRPAQLVQQALCGVGAQVEGGDVGRHDMAVAHAGHGDHLANLDRAEVFAGFQVVDAVRWHAGADPGHLEAMQVGKTHAVSLWRARKARGWPSASSTLSVVS